MHANDNFKKKSLAAIEKSGTYFFFLRYEQMYHEDYVSNIVITLPWLSKHTTRGRNRATALFFVFLPKDLF